MKVFKELLGDPVYIYIIFFYVVQCFRDTNHSFIIWINLNNKKLLSE